VKPNSNTASNRRPKLLAGACLTIAAAGASAATTGFDGLEEDFYGHTFSHGGITFQNAFSNTDQRSFSIDDATQLWQDWGVTDWVQGNVLGMGAYTNGPNGVAFSAIHRVEMTTGSVESSAAFTFMYILDDGHNDFTQNTMAFEALLNGSVVHSEMHNPGNQIYDNGRTTYGATRFSLDGVSFDTIRLTMAGPMNEGRVVGVIDNVTIVPAPGALAVLGLAGVSARRRRR
jgi:hypothetical protein